MPLLSNQLLIAGASGDAGNVEPATRNAFATATFTIENENQLRIQTEALISENQSNETVNLDDVSTINQNVSPTQDTVSVN